jgi:hypothetical protein
VLPGASGKNHQSLPADGLSPGHHEVKRAFQVGGVAALVEEKRGPRGPHPNRVSPEVEERSSPTLWPFPPTESRGWPMSCDAKASTSAPRESAASGSGMTSREELGNIAADKMPASPSQDGCRCWHYTTGGPVPARGNWPCATSLASFCKSLRTFGFPCLQLRFAHRAHAVPPPSTRQALPQRGSSHYRFRSWPWSSRLRRSLGPSF